MRKGDRKLRRDLKTHKYTRPHARTHAYTRKGEECRKKGEKLVQRQTTLSAQTNVMEMKDPNHLITPSKTRSILTSGDVNMKGD